MALPTLRNFRQTGVLFLLFIGCFCVCYYSAAAVTSLHSYRIRVPVTIEHAIPFLPSWVVVYLSLNLMFVMMPFVFRTRRELMPLFRVLIWQTIIAACFFFVLPLASHLEKPPVCGGLGVVFIFAERINLAQNFFPSLHVSYAVTYAIAYGRGRQRVLQAILWLWSAAVIASTLFIHEHYVIDIVGGCALAVLVQRTYSWSKPSHTSTPAQ